VPVKRRIPKNRRGFPPLIQALIAGADILHTEENRSALDGILFFDDPDVPAAAHERARTLLATWRREARWQHQLAVGLPPAILGLLLNRPIERNEENRLALVNATYPDYYPGLTDKQIARADSLVTNWCQKGWVDYGGVLLPPPPGAVVLE
jgi:hypothetical protein